MPVKRKNIRQQRRRRYVRILQCEQCGESSNAVLMRNCSGCDAQLHPWCVVHHHVDRSGDGQHPPRDYSHLAPAA